MRLISIILICVAGFISALATELPPSPSKAIAPANPPTIPFIADSYAPEFVGDRAYEIPGMPATLPDESLSSVSTNLVGWMTVSPTTPTITYYMRFEIRSGSHEANPHTVILRETTEPMEFFSWTVTTNSTFEEG